MRIVMNILIFLYIYIYILVCMQTSTAHTNTHWFATTPSCMAPPRASNAIRKWSWHICKGQEVFKRPESHTTDRRHSHA